ncbi:hypothetical protein ACFS07_29735 [Undibacterium arcticum]
MPNAAPIITATAKSITLPLIAKLLNSPIIDMASLCIVKSKLILTPCPAEWQMTSGLPANAVGHGIGNPRRAVQNLAAFS